MQIESRVMPASGAVVALLHGRVDAHVASSVRSWIDNQFDHGNTTLMMDLSGVNLMDSAALVTLIHGLHLSRARHGEFLIVGLCPLVRVIFELTRTDRAFGIFPTVAEAEAFLLQPE